jgi:hypothetical protein
MAVAKQLVQYILAIVDQLCNRKSKLQNKKAITKKVYQAHGHRQGQGQGHRPGEICSERFYTPQKLVKGI